MGGPELRADLGFPGGEGVLNCFFKDLYFFIFIVNYYRQAGLPNYAYIYINYVTITNYTMTILYYIDL